MRKTILAATAGLSLAFATVAMAETAMNDLTPQPEQMAQPVSAAKDDSKQVVCHNLMHEGALMRQQVCLTKHAWERMRLQTQRFVSDFQVHSYSTALK